MVLLYDDQIALGWTEWKLNEWREGLVTSLGP